MQGQVWSSLVGLSRSSTWLVPVHIPCRSLLDNESTGALGHLAKGLGSLNGARDARLDTFRLRSLFTAYLGTAFAVEFQSCAGMSPEAVKKPKITQAVLITEWHHRSALRSIGQRKTQNSGGGVPNSCLLRKIIGA